MKIKIKIAIILLMAFNSMAVATPIITPTNFLNSPEPIRMDQSYIDHNYLAGSVMFAEPSGGALIRILQVNQDLCLYIFCDLPLHQLRIFELGDNGAQRVPIRIKDYGKIKPPISLPITDTLNPMISIPLVEDSAGYFNQPVDIAVSSWGRYFDPQSDYIYVLDQINHRVVKLHYDIVLDSLIWVGSFGQNYLKFPVAIDYVNYGNASNADDDIYVVDAGVFQIMRFSAIGNFEVSYGHRGSGLSAIGFPSGIAVKDVPGEPAKIYVSDSRCHRVVRYSSMSDGPISAEDQYVFPINPYPIIMGIDLDAQGNIYVADMAKNSIMVLSPSMDQVLLQYGTKGFTPGNFSSPTDIYIDNNEMQVCEDWGDSSGIQSFSITPGSPKRDAGAPLPGKFALFQNYPNPFNSSTTIRFELPQASDVQITVYNILGQRVTRLVDGKMSAGPHSIIWNGANQNGKIVSSGIYFCRLETASNIATKKLLLLK